MNGVALAAVLVNGTVDLAAIGAGWHLVRSGRVRLSAPTPAQLAAGGQSREQEQRAGGGT